jgi:hypothetical protein
MPPIFPIYQAPTVLIDLDDTLAEFDGYRGWRHIGKPRSFAREFVRTFKKYGWRVILWTSRMDVGYIREWLKRHEFTDDTGQPLVDYVNNNPANAELDCCPTKPLADLIIDNSCWPFCGEPVPLEQVLRDLMTRGIVQNAEKRETVVEKKLEMLMRKEGRESHDQS